MPNATPARLVDPGTPPADYAEALFEGFVEAILEAVLFHGVPTEHGLRAALEAANRLAL